MIESGCIGYTGVDGMLELAPGHRRKILERDNGGESLPPDEIAVSDGPKQAIYNALVAILDPEDGYCPGADGSAIRTRWRSLACSHSVLIN